MERKANNFIFNRSGALLGILLLLVIFAAFGCIKKTENYAPPPAKPKAAGLAPAGKFRSVLIKDMNNDGKLDIVGGASFPGMVTINYGDGRSGVSEPYHFPIQGNVRSVAVADFNEDGLVDIVFSVQKESSGVKVLLNQANRQWKHIKGPIEINNYEGVKTADVNGDGHMDIIAANATSDSQGGIQVWLGNGKGEWPVEAGPTVSGVYMDVFPADLNHDGNLDLIGAGWGTHGALRVWLGDGQGRWSSTSPLQKGSFFGLSIGDLNGDGNFDIFAGSYRQGVHIFIGDGRGSFSRIVSPEEKLRRKADAQSKSASSAAKLSPVKEDRSYWAVRALDIDKDGLVDILAGSLDAEGIKAWRNKGKDRWESFKGTTFPSTGTYYEMAIADMNADEHMDICAASFGEGLQMWSGKDGAFKIVRQQQIEKLEPAERLTAAKAPLENNVFKTIDGVAEYKIDAGDTIEITLWEGTTPKKEEIMVRPDGKISFGFVEDLSVKKLTTSQLDHLLTADLKKYVKTPRIDVVVIKYDSKYVQLVGAVNYKGPGTGPGQYKLKGKTTALEAITLAGGPTKDANLRKVRIRRKTGQSIMFNLYKTITQGDLSQNPVLDDGDLVFLPTLSEDGNRVYVFGEVEKPGAYSFAGREMRLLDAISEAGGATINAAEYKTRVVRGDPTRPEIIAANLRNLVEKGDRSQNVALVSGDLIYVPRNGIGNVNRFIEQIFPSLRAIATATSIVVNFDTINSIVD